MYITNVVPEGKSECANYRGIGMLIWKVKCVGFYLKERESSGGSKSVLK